MKTSEHINEIAASLAKAQGTMGPVVKELVAKVKMREDKGEYSYQYADLAAVFDAIRDALSSNQIAVVQSPETTYIDEAGCVVAEVTIVSRLAHASGQWFENCLALRTSDPRPQGIGSAITYGRRYALQSLSGVAAELDDDGSAAKYQPTFTQPRERAGANTQNHQPATNDTAKSSAAVDSATSFWTWARAEMKAGRFTEANVKQVVAANHNDFGKARPALEAQFPAK